MSSHPFGPPLVSEREEAARAFRHKPAHALFPRAAARIAEGMCADTKCDNTIDGFTNSLSRREWTISGLCQSCQDNVFVEGSWTPPEPVKQEEE